ncbi:DNA-directed RNA polymerase subunit L [Methanosarcina sp. 2.H.T.1A.6]|jgi:DNA-directed RNA polymerase subunit L|uniref:DNA-directed RNA polymerase subunit L n=1 Tax=unclassified Methanosarcina TaxID=2644672 RepID=UPI000621D8C6|nr:MULTISPECIES: DNA-directed RNA polymerase subunit L [unclassified Methanosarcina]KKG11905.1 DNA-directed RNA polymerase subunit L [Methanosarcina sp. 2.H.A.1B.4]KKG14140.1 DNA-directed RNA polymerase subunit L [Methanosarcina sp. 2.H.T.1A.3]KKG19630.1 DNA-directed RNA polymerase subunit L [Methanosarcina sp. 2.H.T.1A.6]KKG22133.1 DNA-directed RNA polymerase subunit L [Methanosarcina sp. 2.H.T.1A.15]KKG26781.1 DNA-directed RNA polymerase subunit L [Methanosarcina sp. 2.H.T.1A.8]
MELNIINKTNNELEVEFRGETHTLLNLLKDLLIKDERVEAAFYDMKHVSISDPILYIKTDGTDPILILKETAAIIVAQCDEFIEVFGKAVNA